MNIKNKKLFYLLLALVIIVFFAVIILLGVWTKSIERRKHVEELRSTLGDVISVYGERGLLEMAGIPVNDIYYGENGLTVFKGDTGSWNFSVDELQNISVFENCSDAVVYINTDSTNLSKGVGSGFFVRSNGYICTNKHVIDGSSYISVTTSDSHEYDAVLIGVDAENDIAVIKIEPEEGSEFKTLSFDNSDLLLVGQKVLAIGNPFGYDRTLVTGSVSGLSRPIRSDDGSILLGMIQTDANIYPGNSGGPLLNSKGNVVGVCTSVYNLSENMQGLSFAVSSNAVKVSVDEIIEKGHVTRGWLDLVPVALNKQIVEYASLKVESGLLVSEVVQGGYSQIAGIKGGSGNPVKYGDKSIFFLGGDIITDVNGFSVASISDLYSALSLTKPGDKVDVVVNRNGVINKFKVTLAERTAALLSKTVK